MRRIALALTSLSGAAVLVVGLLHPAVGATVDADDSADDAETQVIDDGAPEAPEDSGPTEELTIEPWDDGTTVSEPIVSPLARTLAAVTPPTWKLPFEAGQKWSSGGPHADSDGTARGAVDFSPGSSANKRVVAIASGRVYKVSCPKGWFLGIDHGGGWKSEYYHLSGAQSSLIGKWVSTGTYLGTAGSTLPCGGSSNGAHVHLSILHGAALTPGNGVMRPYYPVDGMTFGSYTVHAASGAYNGTWTNSSGSVVIRNWGCCLTSNTAKPVAFAQASTPTVSGTAAVGKTLTAKAGTWAPTPTLVYQWKRDGNTISGATASTYTVVKADRGAKLTVSVQGRRTGNITTTKTSKAVSIPSTVTRVAGANRYDTSAAISAATFSAGVSVVYLASGSTFPDALSAAAAAGAQKAPVLLVKKGSIPDVIARELTRLAPKRIVVVGQTGAVSSAVLTAAKKYTSGTVTRVGGATRYATSAAISAHTAPKGVSTVYLASGENYPDALSAAAPAGTAGVPVLLTKAGSLPAEVAAELKRLRPDSITVVGGTLAVSSTVASAAAASAGGASVTRLAGQNRYGTSAAIAAATARAPVAAVYVASGENFPDALSGAAAAAAVGAPVLLTSLTSLPSSIASALTDLQAAAPVVLGGTLAVSHTAAQQVAARAR